MLRKKYSLLFFYIFISIAYAFFISHRTIHTRFLPLSRSSSSSLIQRFSVEKNNQKQSIILDEYNFASRDGWDKFYSQNCDPYMNISNDPMSKYNQSAPINPFEFDWHSSVDNSDILSEIKSKRFEYKSQSPMLNILIVGAGNSALPKLLHDDHNGQNISIVCLDYSTTCIEMLKALYPSDMYPNIKYICGDATKLHNYFNNSTTPYFDYIIDKGLMDALMCGEGWNDDVEKYLKGASMVLYSRELPNQETVVTGKIILISYKLSSSTKSFLEEMGMKYGISWDLDLNEKSNERVSFSVGIKC